jgi:hypothetical protein
MTDGCRVLLLWMLDESGRMAARGIISVPRSAMAKALGVPPARITERIALARELGFLSVVRRGRPRVTAVYQVAIPTGWEVQNPDLRGTESEVRSPFPLRGTESVPPQGGPEVQIPGTQVGNGSRHAERTPAGRHHNVGNDEEIEDQPAGSGLLVCDCHGVSDCESLNRSHIREETA